MKYRFLFVFAICALFVTADSQAQDRGQRRGGDRDGGRPDAGGERRGGPGGERGGPPGRGGPGGGRPSMMTFLPVLIALDADKDGKISSKEIANASAALKTLDKNGDGSLTEDEVRPSFGGRGGRGGPGGGRGGDAQRRGGERGGPPGRDGETSGGTTKPKRPSFDN